MKIRYPLKKLDPTHHMGEAWSYVLFKWPTKLLLWFVLNFTQASPNMVTFVGFLFGVLAGYLFYGGNFITGAVLFALFIMLDYIDGSVARAKKMGSLYGEFMDDYLGIIALFVMAFGLSFGQFNATQDIFWLVLTPFMILLILFHHWEGIFVRSIIGEKYLETVSKAKFIGKSPAAKTLSLLTRIRDFLLRRKWLEPLSMGDQYVLLFFVVPIIASFTGYLKELVMVLIVLFVLKQLFWFWYYRKILLNIQQNSSF